MRAGVGPKERRWARVPGSRAVASIGSCAGAVHTWLAAELLHVAPPAARTRLGRPQALAPDIPGFGDSAPDPPGTFERHVEAIERFRRQLGIDRVVLVVHDTGGLIGLRWACDHPDAVAGLVITNTGFFPDHEWIEIAKTMRTPIQGEALVDSLSREGFATLLEAASERSTSMRWTSTGRRSRPREAAAACSSSIAPSTRRAQAV